MNMMKEFVEHFEKNVIPQKCDLAN